MGLIGIEYARNTDGNDRIEELRLALMALAQRRRRTEVGDDRWGQGERVREEEDNEAGPHGSDVVRGDLRTVRTGMVGPTWR